MSLTGLFQRRPRAAAPGGRGTHAAEGVPAPAPPQGAVGPELIEQAKSAAMAFIVNNPPPGTDQLNGAPARAFYGDVGTPQLFPAHPNIDDLVSEAGIANQLPPGTLPGRVPATVWDGEPGPTAPSMA